MKYHNAKYNLFAEIKYVNHARQVVTFAIVGDKSNGRYTAKWSQFISFFNRI